jgi:hypothetical protein
MSPTSYLCSTPQFRLAKIIIFVKPKHIPGILFIQILAITYPSSKNLKITLKHETDWENVSK